jgi:coenzyme F420 biosynthesis associated uncharacterized protein
VSDAAGSPGAGGVPAASLPPDPIDWPTARRVARAVAGRDAIAGSYLSASLHADFLDVTAEAEELVADHTGLRSPNAAIARVVDRRGWVDVNLASMRRMLTPLTERIGERLAGRPLAPIGRRVAGTELGVLLGYVAQRVLGQYDLLVPDRDGDGSDSGDLVYYVGPNVLALEKRFAFRPREFRRWIAIHEVTHRAQFTGVPWLHGYFLSLVADLLGAVDPDPRALMASLRRVADEVRAGRNPLDGHGVIGLVATAEQKVALDRVQALMTLLEGHGNAVMDDLGTAHVVGATRMSQVLRARRQVRGMAALISKLIGLEMKLRQYEVGERFVHEITRLSGARAVDAAWTAPEALPTTAELNAPASWLARVGAAPAATTSVP